MSLRDELTKMCAQWDRESNAASDLWSWLPSYRAARNRNRPDPDAIMYEACDLIAALIEEIGQKRADEIRDRMMEP